MRVLVLGPRLAELRAILDVDEVEAVERPLAVADVHHRRPDWLVSFGYRHLVPADVLDAVGGRALNVHLSMLPWNRGADPNLWSWLTNTPKGVSVHLMTPGLDRGALLAQRPVSFEPDATLRSSYDRLHGAALDALAERWPDIRGGSAAATPQPDGGSYHRSRDKEPHLGALTAGWDTPCADVADYGRQHGLWIAA